MLVSLDWQTGLFDLGTPAEFSASFQNLIGVAPRFPNSAIVGDNNQGFGFQSATPTFSGDLSFTSVTFTATYTPRKLGQGPLTYQPAGSIAPFGTTARSANFAIIDATAGAADPGRFVSLVLDVPGDYDQNGAVDGADFLVWQRQLGQSGPGLAADGDGSGAIDAADLRFWETHLGQLGVGGLDVRANAVPEPKAMQAFLVAVLAIFSRQRAFAARTH
jgi:hypothetical protein